MRVKTVFVLVVAVLSLGLAVGARGDVLAAWNSQGISPDGGPTNWNATTTAANMQTPSLSRVNLGFGDTVGFGANRFCIGGDGAMVRTSSADTNRYVTFTLRPSSGYQMTINSIDIAVAIQDYGPGTQYEVRYSIDSFATPLLSGVLTDILANPVPLVNATVSGVSNTSAPVEFRVYEFGAANAWITGSVASRNNNTDGLVVNGSVIPEPASAGLAALGAIALLRRLRRRSRA